MNKILLYVVILLSVVLCLVRSFRNETSFFSNTEREEETIDYQNTITMLDVKNSNIMEIDIEDYLIGVVAGEMPALFNDEALKAQAVAARTYAYFKINSSHGNYDITNDSSSQVHLSKTELLKKWGSDYDKYYNKIRKAVNATENEVLVYQNEIIPAYYFAMSNGYTEDSELVFSEQKDYLKSVQSPEDRNVYEVISNFNKTNFCDKLQITCQIIKIDYIKRSNTNRVLSISINNKVFAGSDFRKVLGLRSTDFDILIENENLLITTRGYGHGVGMSQYGANNLANLGYSYDEILSHYYTNVELVKVNSII